MTWLAASHDTCPPLHPADDENFAVCLDAPIIDFFCPIKPPGDARSRPRSATSRPGSAVARRVRQDVTEIEALSSNAMQALREGRGEEAHQLLILAQSRLDMRGDQPPAEPGRFGDFINVDPGNLASSRRPSVVSPNSGGRDAESELALLRAHATTASNWGVYHRKKGEFELAIQHLERAVAFHTSAHAGLRMIAAARLNLAACHQELGGALGEGLQHAQIAVELAGRLLISAPEGTEPPSDDCAMLAVAYHKVAELHEAMRDWGKASHAYTQAYEVVHQSLGPSHHLTRTFERSSRCPRHIAVQAAPPTPQKLSVGVLGTPRLPSIPRAKTLALQPKRSLEYDLGPDVLAPWPPKNASREEKRWYSMSRKREAAKCPSSVQWSPNASF